MQDLFDIFRNAWFAKPDEGEGHECQESGSENDDPEVDPALMGSEDSLHPASILGMCSAF